MDVSPVYSAATCSVYLGVSIEAGFANLLLLILMSVDRLVPLEEGGAKTGYKDGTRGEARVWPGRLS